MTYLIIIDAVRRALKLNSVERYGALCLCPWDGPIPEYVGFPGSPGYLASWDTATIWPREWNGLTIGVQRSHGVPHTGVQHLLSRIPPSSSSG